MTPKERAEKIFLMRHMFSDNRIGQEIIVQKIACEIEKAQEEAVGSDMREKAKTYGPLIGKEAYALGFAAAKKQAAKIAREFDVPCLLDYCHCDGNRIAAEIEKMDVKP